MNRGPERKPPHVLGVAANRNKAIHQLHVAFPLVMVNQSYVCSGSQRFWCQVYMSYCLSVYQYTWILVKLWTRHTLVKRYSTVHSAQYNCEYRWLYWRATVEQVSAYRIGTYMSENHLFVFSLQFWNEDLQIIHNFISCQSWIDSLGCGESNLLLLLFSATKEEIRQ